MFTYFEPQKVTETRPEVSPKSSKIRLFATSCPSRCSHGPPRWSRGAKMASRGASETPKWLPKVLPRCQNGHPRCFRDAKMAPRMSKRRHHGSQMATARSKKGPAAENVALKIYILYMSVAGKSGMRMRPLFLRTKYPTKMLYPSNQIK